ncbi:MAG: hypothetical protein H8E14_06175 [Candidatus Marinimicrobia bacterium]|nr:hypothetical protein [Candidatus Neomarinimicrobiota bacterium]
MSIRKDFLITFSNAIAVIFGVFIINWYIARNHGMEILGHYLYFRRVFTSLIGFSLVGMNIGLPYFLPRSKNTGIINSAKKIFTLISIPIIVILSLFISSSTSLNDNQLNIIVYIIYGIGLNSQAITYALYRGKLKMFKASIIQFTCVALVPFAMFYFYLDFSTILLSIGLLTIGISSFGWIQPAPNSSSYNEVKIKLKLFKFGIVRIVGFIGQAALLTGIPIILANTVHINNIAYFNSSLSVFRLILLILGPISIILLPRISKAFEDGINNAVIMNLEMLIYWTIIFSWVISFPLFIIGPKLLILWLGGEMTNNINIIGRIFITMPLYAITIILRSPIDAVSKRGYNTIIYAISAIFMFISYIILVSLLDNYIVSAVISFFIGYSVAALLSIYFAKKLIGINIDKLNILVLLISFSIINILFITIIKLIFDQFIPQLVSYWLVNLTLVSAYVFKSNEKHVTQFRNLIFNKGNV